MVSFTFAFTFVRHFFVACTCACARAREVTRRKSFGKTARCTRRSWACTRRTGRDLRGSLDLVRLCGLAYHLQLHTRARVVRRDNQGRTRPRRRRRLLDRLLEQRPTGPRGLLLLLRLTKLRLLLLMPKQRKHLRRNETLGRETRTLCGMVHLCDVFVHHADETRLHDGNVQLMK